MKRKILFLLLIGVLISVVTPVMAANGPSDSGEISFSYADGSKRVYYEGDIDNNAEDGVTYDLASNTLTIKNLKFDSSKYEDLYITYMGDDFKLNVVGENEVSRIYISEGTLTITGNGTLIINQERGDYSAIDVYEGKLIIDKTVTLKAYTKVDEDEGYQTPVICILESDTDNINDAIIIKSGKSYEMDTEEKTTASSVNVKAFWLRDSYPYSFKFATKDGKNYGVYHPGATSEWRLYDGEIKYNDILEDYIRDSSLTNSASYTVYDSPEAITAAGYTYDDSSEAHSVKQNSAGDVYTFKDKVTDKTYAALHDSYDVYDFTGEDITLADGKTYALLKRNYVLDHHDLEEVLNIEYTGEYNHFITSDSFEQIGEKTKNPKTGDGILASITLLSVYVLALYGTLKYVKRN